VNEWVVVGGAVAVVVSYWTGRILWARMMLNFASRAIQTLEKVALIHTGMTRKWRIRQIESVGKTIQSSLVGIFDEILVEDVDKEGPKKGEGEKS